eukprot:4995644-Pyramimonas_sp.AAC.1
MEEDFRASPRANPYVWLSPGEAYTACASWLDARADLHNFLTPLSGQELWCSCQHGEFCHGRLLLEAVNNSLPKAAEEAEEQVVEEVGEEAEEVEEEEEVQESVLVSDMVVSSAVPRSLLNETHGRLGSPLDPAAFR